jgi:hypothetical protein
MKFWLSAAILCMLSLSSSSAQQPAQQPKITGFFTDMHYIAEVGDVLGSEIWIVYARGKFWAVVQSAEGAPDPPQVVPVEASGTRVKFSTRTPMMHSNGEPAPDEVIEYSGTVSKAGLMLSVHGSPPTLLKRQNSYWQ